jgi:Spy/CpxP family protein refolding chaperone
LPARGTAALLAVSALALAVGVAQVVQAQPRLDQPLLAPAGEGMGPGPGGMGMGMGMAHHRGAMGPGGAPLMGGPLRGRLLDLVKATPEQRSKIESIWQAARADLAQLHEQGQALHQRSMDLFLQPSIDAQAAEALRQQMLTQHDAASKRMLQAMIDSANVLTPEQRKTLADKTRQRREMMERHRAERAKLDQSERTPAREPSR